MDDNLMFVLANVLIGIGLGISLVVGLIWLAMRRFENDLQVIIREKVQEVEKNLEGIAVEEVVVVAVAVVVLVVVAVVVVVVV